MVLAVILTVIVVAAVFLWPLRQEHARAGKAQPPYPVDMDGVATRLSQIIQCRTISRRGSEEYLGEFERLHVLLEESYPLVHKTMTKRVVNGYTLLYRWETGSDKLPILLMAHQDVVPISEGTEDDWEHPPFSGDVVDGFVWGRGAIDMKNMLAAEFEALEYLIADGFTPDRDIYLLLGHDEEVIGLEGALKAAELLEQEDVYFEYVLDEGCHFSGMEHYGVSDKLVANIGIYEKGYVDLHITTTGDAGHSSTPGKGTALSDLARAVNMLESNMNFVPTVTDMYKQRLKYILPHANYATKLTGTYINVFGDGYVRLLQNSPEEYAMLRSTMASTMISGSNAPNVLPAKADAWFNFRLNPGDTVEKLQKQVEQVLPDRIKKEYPTAHDASRLASVNSRAFGLISDSILATFDDVVVAPCGFYACTDSRHMHNIAKDIYKFIPFTSNYLYKSGMHGTNERIDIEDYVRGISFFIRLIQGSTS